MNKYLVRCIQCKKERLSEKLKTSNYCSELCRLEHLKSKIQSAGDRKKIEYDLPKVKIIRRSKKSRKAKLKSLYSHVQSLESRISKLQVAIEKKRELHPFYDSREWRDLRYYALKLYGRKCQLCFATNTQIHVDHIKPRSKYPELALDIKNLQILCKDCNLGKSNKDETDWR